MKAPPLLMDLGFRRRSGRYWRVFFPLVLLWPLLIFPVLLIPVLSVRFGMTNSRRAVFQMLSVLCELRGTNISLGDGQHAFRIGIY